jgi:hypothetical protein
MIASTSSPLNRLTRRHRLNAPLDARVTRLRRDRYDWSVSTVDAAQGSANKHGIEQTFLHFVSHDEPLTRSTADGWSRRLDALAQFFPDGLEAGPTLDDVGMRLDCLFWMAEALAWHGFPGRALAAFTQHDALCRAMGSPQSRRLASALAHHSDALRQCGRLHDADIVARDGLDLERRVGDRYTVALHLFWFGLGLSSRGEARESSAALDEATTMLKVERECEPMHPENRAEVSVLFAQRARHQHDIGAMRSHALEALSVIEIASENGQNGSAPITTIRLITRATRLLAEASLLTNRGDEAVAQFDTTLRLADSVRLVDEVAYSLAGLARAGLLADDLAGTRRWINAIFPLAHEGPYPIHDAEAHFLLAELEQRTGNHAVAQQARERAQRLLVCDAPPFSYVHKRIAHQF